MGQRLLLLYQQKYVEFDASATIVIRAKSGFKMKISIMPQINVFVPKNDPDGRLKDFLLKQMKPIRVKQFNTGVLYIFLWSNKQQIEDMMSKIDKTMDWSYRKQTALDEAVEWDKLLNNSAS